MFADRILLEYFVYIIRYFDSIIIESNLFSYASFVSNTRLCNIDRHMGQ